MIQQIFTYTHLIGFALGFGGAIVSDAIFFNSIKDKHITKTEYRFMALGGKLVWLGLAILLLSGIGLVWIKPELLSSSKFLIKMFVVVVIAVNGLIFHKSHLPHIFSHLGIPFHKSTSFKQRSHLLTFSGVISVVSWLFATFLGASSSLPYTLSELLITYIGCLTLAVIIGAFVDYKIFHK